MATPSARPSVALDSNVLNALLRQEPNAVQVAAVLGQLQRTHALVICPVVYAELLAGPGATVPVLQGLLTGSGVALDLNLPVEIWERANARGRRTAAMPADGRGAAAACPGDCSPTSSWVPMPRKPARPW